MSSIPRVKQLTITLPQWWNIFVSLIPVEEEGTNKLRGLLSVQFCTVDSETPPNR